MKANDDSYIYNTYNISNTSSNVVRMVHNSFYYHFKGRIKEREKKMIDIFLFESIANSIKDIIVIIFLVAMLLKEWD